MLRKAVNKLFGTYGRSESSFYRELPSQAVIPHQQNENKSRGSAWLEGCCVFFQTNKPQKKIHDIPLDNLSQKDMDDALNQIRETIGIKLG
jgi:hypothetical protein